MEPASLRASISQAARRKMSSVNKKHVNVERRTWDKEAYEARARSRASVEESGDDHKPTAAARADGPSSLLKHELEPEEEKEEFAKADEGRQGPMGSERAFLKARSKRVDLESKVGSSEIIDPGRCIVRVRRSLGAGNLLCDARCCQRDTGNG